MMDRQDNNGVPEKNGGERPDGLESLVSHLARSQPMRRAPASLQQRVLAQLSLQRSTLPWWRSGFANWPLAARAAFLIASCGFVWLALSGVMSMISFLGTREAAETTLSWANSWAQTLSTVGSMGSALIRALPPTWLYAAIAVGFALYAVLFGLGAVAYRTLYVQR